MDIAKPAGFSLYYSYVLKLLYSMVHQETRCYQCASEDRGPEPGRLGPGPQCPSFALDGVSAEQLRLKNAGARAFGLKSYKLCDHGA